MAAAAAAAAGIKVTLEYLEIEEEGRNILSVLFYLSVCCMYLGKASLLFSSLLLP